ncbi:MAG: hypothetical protein R3C56_14230 [Pirellulaceae bacterium]
MQAALVCCWLLGAALAISDDQIGAGHARFETKVRPVLVEHCIECHGANKQEGDCDSILRRHYTLAVIADLPYSLVSRPRAC